MDIRKVKKLIELLEESGISEIEIHEGEESVRITRYSASAPVYASPAMPTVDNALLREAPAPETPGPVGGGPLHEVEPELDGHVIRAPMVGTYYSSTAPGNPPFVEKGQSVKKGDVLCLIEAMKIMNQIEVDIDGTISAVLAENGQPVEYDQPLFVIG